MIRGLDEAYILLYQIRHYHSSESVKVETSFASHNSLSRHPSVQNSHCRDFTGILEDAALHRWKRPVSHMRLKVVLKCAEHGRDPGLLCHLDGIRYRNLKQWRLGWKSHTYRGAAREALSSSRFHLHFAFMVCTYVNI